MTTSVQNMSDIVNSQLKELEPVTIPKTEEIVEQNDQMDISESKTFELPFFSRPQHYKLELIHIPKTGGSALEQAASSKKIFWGYYHFTDKRKNGDYYRHQIEKVYKARGQQLFTKVLWHLPISQLQQNNVTHNVGTPYDNKDTFIVVRDPYDRLLSEFFYKMNNKRKNKKRLNKKFLNRTVITWLLQFKENYQENQAGHLIPQHEFLFDKNDKIVVDHVLRFDHLKEDFTELVKLYPGYLGDLELPEKAEKGAKSGAHINIFNLTVDDFDSDTKRLIEDVYAKDFEYFGFQKAKENISEAPS